jgi:futalosine hydrolase
VSDLLIVTAVAAEADAVLAGLDGASVTVEPVGVGVAAAAAGTARLLTLAEAAGTPYQAVLSAGLAGGFPGHAEMGATVIGARSIAADLGAETPDGFVGIDELGFGVNALDADAGLLRALASALPGSVLADILTVATVTGTATTAARLVARYPAAAAEAMEGYGVAIAAAAAGLPFAELRTISNPIGPRDRGSWRVAAALAALTNAAALIRSRDGGRLA